MVAGRLGKKKIILIGWGKPFYDFYNILKFKRKYEIIIITHKKKNHLNDIKYFDNKKIFFDIFSIKDKVKIIQTDKINIKIINFLIKNKTDLIISAGSKFIFKKKFINTFKNKIINFHPSFLPEERGGANFTYRILNNQYYAAATAHYVDEGIDTGDIIEQKKIFIKKNDLENLFINTYKLYSEIFKKILNNKIVKKKQKMQNANYFKKLNSELDGKINWNWDGKYIELFIKAFGRPYKGAFCLINKKKIYILKAKFLKSKNVHPFLYGKVFKNFNDGRCHVFCKGGFLEIIKVSLDVIMFSPNKIIKLKDSLN
jgi:methionyl-tRNA formyltransferase